ncbi:MAG: cupin domain-containing protein [Acidobacteriota bacterium]|nr:cupin domain-containing protein [Acidobacteriota bacterium]
MEKVQRRSFLQLVLAAMPSALFGQTTVSGAPGPLIEGKVAMVPAGMDREQKKRTIGVSSTTYKVLTRETNGAMFAMEQSNSKKGGPPRHFHHEQDELFFVLEGEYIVEIGPDRFHLKAGDCVLGPRMIPHAWAFVGESTGRMLLSYSPAGQMEAFFNEWEHAGIKPGTYARAGTGGTGIMESHGVTQVGPPIAVD